MLLVITHRAQRPAVRIPRDQPVVGRAGIADHQMVRVGVTNQVIEIDSVVAQQFLDQRAGQQPVGAGIHRHPFVRDRGIAGTTGLTATILAPRAFSLPSPSLIGLESWSSATPHSIRYFVRSQSGSPNSQNEPPKVYMPAAAMLTEQKPPCAA